MFTYHPPSPGEEAPSAIAEAFQAMQEAMERSPEWRNLAAARQATIKQPLQMRRIRRLSAAERTAIAKKAAAARWAKVRQRLMEPMGSEPLTS